MLPTPLVLPHAEPADAEQVHAAPTSTPGSESAIVAAMMGDGPELVAMIVYATGAPAATLVRPSVLVIDRSAVGVIDVVSVAALSAGSGSLTPDGASIRAVLTTTPVVAATVAVTVKVAVEPTARLRTVLMLPVPEARHPAPADATQVHVAPVKAAGNVSTTGAPTTADGPALEATIV